MFKPLTFRKVAPVREALGQGVSFAASRHDNEYSLVTPLAALRRHYYDTGARIFDFLRYRKMMYFVGLPEPTDHRFCHHYFGTTRIALYGPGQSGTTEGGGPNRIEPQVRRRLAAEYGEYPA